MAEGTDLGVDRRIPLSPLLLGLAGLLPFVGLTIAVLLDVRPPRGLPSAADSLATYAAIILSFLGGVRWGATVVDRRDDRQFAIAVVPSLVAWALLAVPEPWRLVGLGVVAMVLGPIDWHLVSLGLVPLWFGRLRLILSSCAGLCLLIAASRGA